MKKAVFRAVDHTNHCGLFGKLTGNREENYCVNWKLDKTNLFS